MGIKHFVDTSILVCAIDASDPSKQAVATELITNLSHARTAALSTQVLLEYTHTLTHQFKVSKKTAGLMAAAFAQWQLETSDQDLVMHALARSAESDTSIWDAMIIEAALRSGAQTLYSEDFSHGQRFGRLQVMNPFL
jgi:predicted nucleic acid-binding protein